MQGAGESAHGAFELHQNEGLACLCRESFASGREQEGEMTFIAVAGPANNDATSRHAGQLGQQGITQRMSLRSEQLPMTGLQLAAGTYSSFTI